MDDVKNIVSIFTHNRNAAYRHASAKNLALVKAHHQQSLLND